MPSLDTSVLMSQSSFAPDQTNRILGSLKDMWAFWLSSLILLIWVAITVAGTVQWNDGELVYALDDAYIHTALAKNIVQHVPVRIHDAFRFSSCSRRKKHIRQCGRRNVNLQGTACGF